MLMAVEKIQLSLYTLHIQDSQTIPQYLSSALSKTARVLQGSAYKLYFMRSSIANTKKTMGNLHKVFRVVQCVVCDHLSY